MERNSCRNPWQNYLNARLGVSIPTVSGQGIELSLDLFNVLNFMDHDWGLYKQVSEFEEGPRFLSATGFDAANNRPIYRFSPPTQIEQIVSGENTAGVNRSRWTMQVGARYRFYKKQVVTLSASIVLRVTTFRYLSWSSSSSDSAATAVFRSQARSRSRRSAPIRASACFI